MSLIFGPCCSMQHQDNLQGERRGGSRVRLQGSRRTHPSMKSFQFSAGDIHLHLLKTMGVLPLIEMSPGLHLETRCSVTVTSTSRRCADARAGPHAEQRRCPPLLCPSARWAIYSPSCVMSEKPPILLSTVQCPKDKRTISARSCFV